MIKSMTAFAQSTHTSDTITVKTTIRSYNSRYLDIVCHIPESCQTIEDRIKKLISRNHDRGRVEIRLTIEDEQEATDLFEVDKQKAGAYYKALSRMKRSYSLVSDIGLDHMLTLKNIIVPLKKELDTEKLWAAVQPCLEEASRQLDRMRQLEGGNLYQDLSSRVDNIEEQLELVQKEAGEIPKVYQQKLMDRISELTSDLTEIDPVRITQEAAILADKSDVSEEIVRLNSHIQLFRKYLAADSSQGKKLNFLIQEFNREFNTIGSKAGNVKLSHLVVELKSQIEKIREQVQNIE